MRIDIITVLPELLGSPFETSILQRAQDKGKVEVHIHDLRNYGKGKHKQVDDYAFGGGAGMVMTCEPIFTLINELKSERAYDAIIYTTQMARLSIKAWLTAYPLKKISSYFAATTKVSTNGLGMQ